MMEDIEIIARFLEDFAYQVEDEGRAQSPMIRKNETSWQGFTRDAEKLLRLLQPPPS